VLTYFETLVMRHLLATLGHADAAHEVIASIRVVERFHSGVGVITELAQRDLRVRLQGHQEPNAPAVVFSHPGLRHDGMAFLRVDTDGRIGSLEAFTFGSEDWPGDASREYVLRPDIAVQAADP
jgi:hypothetical protein